MIEVFDLSRATDLDKQKLPIKTVNGVSPNSSGDVVVNDYVTKLSVSGKTITYTKKNGSTGTITTQDTVYSHPSTHPASMITGLATVATSGSYNDLSNKPYIASVPVGTVIAMAANSAPSGYLLCNGAAVSRTTYAKLFEVIGGTYGAGNGSTTFNLPNLTDKFIQGSDTAGTVKAAGLPNIVGGLRGNYSGNPDGTYYGAISSGEAGKITWGLAGSGMIDCAVHFSATNSNSIYGNSATVQPPALTMRYYIKY